MVRTKTAHAPQKSKAPQGAACMYFPYAKAEEVKECNQQYRLRVYIQEREGNMGHQTAKWRVFKRACKLRGVQVISDARPIQQVTNVVYINLLAAEVLDDKTPMISGYSYHTFASTASLIKEIEAQSAAFKACRLSPPPTLLPLELDSLSHYFTVCPRLKVAYEKVMGLWGHSNIPLSLTSANRLHLPTHRHRTERVPTPPPSNVSMNTVSTYESGSDVSVDTMVPEGTTARMLRAISRIGRAEIRRRLQEQEYPEPAREGCEECCGTGLKQPRVMTRGTRANSV